MTIKIRLPNFYNHTALNTLKEKMGIPRNVYGDFGNAQQYAGNLALTSEGMEIDIQTEVDEHEDHTLVHNGNRIIVYIRDIANYSGEYSLPRFHVAYCSTYQQMVENNRKRRYIGIQPNENLFKVNIVNGRAIIDSFSSPLSVCKNCLAKLCWEGYHNNLSLSEKDALVNDFTFERFFEKYPRSVFDKKGHSSKTDRVNVYPKNWDEISKSYRESKYWICEKCNVNLSSYHRLLHVHHKDGNKANCSFSNLEALCVDCHANEPNHSHMKGNPRTREDIMLVQRIRNAQQIS